MSNYDTNPKFEDFAVKTRIMIQTQNSKNIWHVLFVAIIVSRISFFKGERMLKEDKLFALSNDYQ